MMTPLLISSLGPYLGAALCSAVAARGAWSLWHGWREKGQRLRRSARETAGFLRQLQGVRLRTRAADPRRVAWQGTRTLRVVAVADEARECRSFFLADPDGKPLPAFQPGQYLTFELPTSNEDRPTIRCYSLSDRPRPDYYRVTIKRASPPAAQPHLPIGKGSNYFFEHVRPGSTLEVKAPTGSFFLDPSNREPVVLIGSGIGITPVLAMLNTIVHEQPGRRVYFFSGMRSQEEHPFQYHLRAVAAEHPQVRLVVCHSAPAAEEQQGRDFDHQGRLSVDVLRQHLPSNNFRYYVCGSGAMMAELIPALEAWGVPEQDIYYESFGPSTVHQLQQAVMPLHVPQGTAATVRFARSNCTAAFAPGQQSLLELAEQNGLQLEAGCRTGNCGACLVRLLAGEVSYSHRPGTAIPAGECLTCVGIPAGDVVLDA